MLDPASIIASAKIHHHAASKRVGLQGFLLILTEAPRLDFRPFRKQDATSSFRLHSLCTLGYITYMECEVLFTDEFGAWWDSLTVEEQDSVDPRGGNSGTHRSHADRAV
jgi:hypothetical protein